MASTPQSDFGRSVLALDSALGGCIAAVFDPARDIVHSETLVTERDQAAKLVPLIQSVLAMAGTGFADLGLIVTTSGPGSFTGLRIGLSTARSLSMALSVPLQGVSTFEAMLASAGTHPNAPRLVLLESKRRDFYAQLFAQGLSESEPFCAETEQILSQIPVCTVIGDGAGRFAQEAGERAQGWSFENRTLLDPEALARLGLRLFLESGRAPKKVEPLYLRGADVSMPKKKNREIDMNSGQ